MRRSQRTTPLSSESGSTSTHSTGGSIFGSLFEYGDAGSGKLIRTLTFFSGVPGQCVALLHTTVNVSAPATTSPTLYGPSAECGGVDVSANASCPAGPIVSPLFVVSTKKSRDSPVLASFAVK